MEEKEYTKKVNNVLEKQEIKALYTNGQDPEITGSRYSGSFEFEDPFKEGLIGYSIFLREIGKENNLYVNDLLTIGDIKVNNIEKVILMNEEIAREFYCNSITVEGGDLETKQIYQKMGYAFEEGKYIGVKEV